MQKCEKIPKKHAKIVPKREQNGQQNAGKKTQKQTKSAKKRAQKTTQKTTEILKKSAKKSKKNTKKRRKHDKKNASKTPTKYQEIRHLFCKDPVEGAPKGVTHGIKTCPTSSTKVLRLGHKTANKTIKK